MKTADLIDELKGYTSQHINDALFFLSLPLEQLRHKDHAESWSVLECIEHLNRYGDFYIPEIRRRLERSPYPKSEDFQSGLLGGYFASMMLPKERLNKMKTFRSMNPLNSDLDVRVLDRFIRQQKEILELLEKSKYTDLVKVKTSISISKWIRLRLGDTFKVVVYHNLRHIRQAKNNLTETPIHSPQFRGLESTVG
ncbi:DinB family protein [Algoriphagus sp. H41]|uniref:DinB family protein n=1 Tax=Algoriphagus oliviformis TaxID=2811231 RepID=A0ABS3C8G8_9BACT|nr:DinB family protein [Algoriphagus oliviformis]MBN7813409.1 DinB family protein [Algoriphagus oliviformis]